MRRALLLLALLAVPASAESWVPAGRTGAGVLMAVDKDSIQLADGHASYWDRLVYPEPKPVGIYDNTPMKGEFAKGATFFTEMRSYQVADCGRMTLMTQREVFYDAGGRMVSNVLQQIGPRAVAPDSIGGREVAMVCAPSTLPR